MPIELNHKTLQEAINYHETWFEYYLNMGHLAMRDSGDVSSSGERQFTQAAVHANILAELRRHATDS